MFVIFLYISAALKETWALVKNIFVCALNKFFLLSSHLVASPMLSFCLLNNFQLKLSTVHILRLLLLRSLVIWNVWRIEWWNIVIVPSRKIDKLLISSNFIWMFHNSLSTLIHKHENELFIGHLYVIAQSICVLSNLYLIFTWTTFGDERAVENEIKLISYDRYDFRGSLRFGSDKFGSISFLTTSQDDSPLITNNKIIQNLCWAQLFLITRLLPKCEMLHQTFHISHVSHFGPHFATFSLEISLSCTLMGGWNFRKLLLLIDHTSTAPKNL